MRRSRRVPRSLLAILAVVLVEGLAWAFVVPALQGADEGGHLSYIQEIADDHEIPWRHTDEGLLEREFALSVSTDQRVAWFWGGLEMLRGNPAARPLWTPTDERIYRERAAQITDEQRQDAVGSAAWRNPPLYYLSAAVPYEIAGGTIVDRVFAVRLYNVVLLLALVALTWLLAGEVLGRRRELQTVAAAAVALQPVLLDVGTKITPDTLLAVLSAAVLYLMALVVRLGPRPRLVGMLVCALVAAGLVQPRAVGLLAPAALAVGLAWWRQRARPAPASDSAPPAGGVTVRHLLAWGAVAFALLVVVALYATSFRPGELAGFWSYLWQFYLPALPGMTTPIGPDWGVEQVYLERFFATFVQFEVGFPRGLFDALRVAVLGGLALLVVAAVRHRDELRARRDLLAVLIAALVLGVLALHAAAFRELQLNPADPIITGRYLLMFVPLYGVGVAAATTALPGRARAFGTGALVAAMALLQVAALGEVVGRFYA